MYQLPDWESGRLSSKDELLVVILQNFFPFADSKSSKLEDGVAKSARRFFVGWGHAQY